MAEAGHSPIRRGFCPDREVQIQLSEASWNGVFLQIKFSEANTIVPWVNLQLVTPASNYQSAGLITWLLGFGSSSLLMHVVK